MNSFLTKSWQGVIAPLLRRPPVVQMAALCWRKSKSGKEILLVTSSQGRWILPKGWPIDGRTGAQTALQEAWEEAGVKRGKAKPEPFGGYDCIKQLSNGTQVPCRIAVFSVEVEKTTKTYPEADERDRRWVSLSKARKLVTDPGLSDLLAKFGKKGAQTSR